jgi:antitoxin component of MazEF toxin-antitoxin module
MDSKFIAKLGNPVMLIIPPEMLEKLGIKAGDEVEISLTSHKLVVQSREQANREQRMKEIKQELFAERRTVYEHLAEGAS